ncbi:saposin B domain-containing protein [Euphorbia peplus]|nr:saposin B domain-containing protein [Euphorbia peplus]
MRAKPKFHASSSLTQPTINLSSSGCLLLGIMNMRIRFLFLLVLGVGWASAARPMTDTEVSDRTMVIFDILPAKKDNQVCTLCEEFAEQAVDYMTENKTQTEIIETLHKACTQMPSFKQQCITLVDYYAPLFFLEVSSVQPEQFCRKVNLCHDIAYISSKLQEDKCGICHKAVSEVLVKLKNPDTQLEILELLLKSCESMENYASKCKRLVFEYGPLIITNAEQFLETKDICTMLHACDRAQVSKADAATILKADS